MKELREHAHLYLLIFFTIMASCLIAAGGILSIWRMNGVEREMAKVSSQYKQIVANHIAMTERQEIIIQNQRVILKHIAREEASWPRVPLPK
jgi:hypothetical protein